MSWLFDQLTTLAGADRVHIVVRCADDGRVDALLAEAHHLPQTRVGGRLDEQRGTALCRFVATDGDPDLFAGLGDNDLGVAVGAHAPEAHVSVPSMDDLVSLLATLITLRSYVHAPSN